MCVCSRSISLSLLSFPYRRLAQENGFLFSLLSKTVINSQFSLIFSLYRALSLPEAEEKFNAFTQRLPAFIGIAKEVS